MIFRAFTDDERTGRSLAFSHEIENVAKILTVSADF